MFLFAVRTSKMAKIKDIKKNDTKNKDLGLQFSNT